MKKIMIIGVLVTSLWLGGCGHPHFTSLTEKPSSITITKYEDSNKANKTTYTLKGNKMTNLYQAIKKEAKHVLPKNAKIACPSYSTETTIWNYKVVLNYTDHTRKSFTQTTEGCTFLKDDQTGAVSYGDLPSLSPF